MKVTPTALPEVLLIQPVVHADARGFFTERFNQRDFARATGQNVQFVQDNHSHSAHAVLRGLHYQSTEPQGKLVQVQSGRVFDVAVDVRANSPTLGQWVGLELSSAHHQQLWIPAGFAHGFLVLSEQADVLYKTTTYYQPQAEQVLAWNDPSLAIDWPLAALHSAPLLSARDALGKAWSDAPRLVVSSAV
ncbi:MAG: dTDP-4-dehydrorhamnose 3,5-epimerase [Burkholderiales bacterium]